MKPYQPFITILIILALATGIDILVIKGCLLSDDRPTDALTTVFIMVPCIVVINLLLALVLYLLKLKIASSAVVVNAILAPFLFTQLSKAHYQDYERKHFKRYYFTLQRQPYELMLDRRDTLYSISELFEGSSIQVKSGKYILNNNVVILTDSTRRVLINDHQLMGYPSTNDTIQLSERKD